jgi:hypothetical protein
MEQQWQSMDFFSPQHGKSNLCLTLRVAFTEYLWLIKLINWQDCILNPRTTNIYSV